MSEKSNQQLETTLIKLSVSFLLEDMNYIIVAPWDQGNNINNLKKSELVLINSGETRLQLMVPVQTPKTSEFQSGHRVVNT